VSSPPLPETIDGVRFGLVPKAVPRIETRYRRIVTDLPVPESLPVLATLHAHEPRSMWADGPPVVFDRAEGFQIWDRWGNCWIDFACNAYVMGGGHGHPKVVAAMKAALDKPLINSYLYPTEIRARLVEKLATLRPGLDCALLFSTGAETVEAALMMTRLHGRRTSPGKVAMVSFHRGFHGKTLGARMLGGYPTMKGWIGATDPNIHHIAFPMPGECPWDPSLEHRCDGACFDRSMRKLFDDGLAPESIAGFIMEPYQGWTSLLAPPAYAQAMRAWADAHGALLVFDEVQGGFGRSGKLFAFEHLGVEPDLLCLGKAIANGVPLSAVLGRRELIDVDSSLNSTHSGNPLLCAASLAAVEVVLEERLPERAARLGAILGDRLAAIQQRFRHAFPEMYGVGMTWCLLPRDPATRALRGDLPPRIAEAAMHKGLMLMSAIGPYVKVAPPLVIEEDALIEGTDVLEECFAEVLGG
jgi:4-aminobutyrate aminotransferase / (S)-3-amino-2-methylpropionate transaminase / 5-aminovalerate transaminase